MPTLTVNGHSVTVDDGFAKLSPQEQNDTVEEIAKSLPQEKPSGVVAGLKEGLSNAIHGPAETLKTFAGADTSSMEHAAQAVAPKDYQSAPVLGPDSHWYNPASYNWKNVPQMLAENAPQMAEGMAGAKAGQSIGGVFGPVGRVVGGAIGGAAPFILNTLGDKAKSNAVARTGDATAEPNSEDKTRAAITTGVQAIPQSIGAGRLINPGAVTAVGAKGVAQALAKGAATTGIEGATGAATNAIGQAGDTIGTPGGLNVDPNQVAEAGVGQGITGGAMSLPRMLTNAATAKKYAKYGGDNAAATEEFANSIKDAADGADLKNTKNAFNAVRQAHEDTISQLQDAVKNAGASSPETDAVIARATKGRVLSDADLSQLDTNATPDVAALARRAHVGAMLKQEGDFQNTGNGEGKFTGGIANAVGKHIRAIQNPTGAVASGVLGATVGGAHAASLFAYTPETMAAIATAYGAMRGVDAMTGNRSPANKFVNQFGTDNPTPQAGTPQPAPSAPAPTTSVPQVSPPSPPAQPWGAPAPAPTPMNASAVQQQIKGALLMAAARRKVAGQQQAEAEAQDSHAINEQGGLDALSNPSLGKRAKEILANADAMRRLRAAPPEEAPPADPSAIPQFLPDRIPSFLPKRTADVPVAPVAAQMPATPSPVAPAPAAPEGPSVSDLIARMKAKAAGPQLPPATIVKTKDGEVNMKTAEPVVDTTQPYPDKVVDRSAPRDHTKTETTKLTPHEVINADSNLTSAYEPLQAHELYGKNMTHDEFAAKETADKLASGELKPDNAQKYHDAVVMDRKTREHVLQQLSQSSVGPDDTPALKALLDQLHHIRRGETATAAIRHYASFMSAPMRANTLKRLDSSFVHHMWSKEK